MRTIHDPAATTTDRRRRDLCRYAGLVWVMVTAGLGSHATAQLQDDFEGYDLGPICWQGAGWQEWCNCDLGVCGDVTNEVAAHSGSQSLIIIGYPSFDGEPGDYVVHPFGIDGGQWVISYWMYVPSSDNGAAALRFFSDYNDFHGAETIASEFFVYNWDGFRRMIKQGSGETVDILYDQWVEFRVEVDLDVDRGDGTFGSADYYYDGVRFVSGASWATTPEHTRLEGLAFWGTDGRFATTGIYIDDVSVLPLDPGGQSWTEFARLSASDATPGDTFGISVAVSGNTAIVGASGDDDAGDSSGSAHVFDVHGGQQVFKLAALDAAAGDLFGISVAAGGNLAIVGASDNDDAGESSGAAYVFDLDTGAQLSKLTASDAAAWDHFGYAVALSGNIAIIGAFGDGDAGAQSGSAYVFDVDTGQELYKLTAGDAAAGDYFGVSVGLSGDIAVIGSRYDDDAGLDSGAAYLFDVTTGVQLCKLTASDGAAGDLFGNAVGISGDTVIVGAFADAGSRHGSAYLYNATTGSQLLKLTADDAAHGDLFGCSVGISGDTAIVGALFDDDAGADSGSAYLFDVSTGAQIHKLTASDAEAGDRFGASVALSGNTAITGAPFGGVSDAGSAYLFAPSGPLDLSFAQLDWYFDDALRMSDLSWCQVTLSFVGMTELRFFNLNVNGQWVIQNMSVASLDGPGVEQRMSYLFDLGSPPNTDVPFLDWGASLTPALAGMPPVDHFDIPVGDLPYQIGAEVGIDLPPPGPLERGAPPSTENLDAEGRLPQIDKFVNQPAGSNECVPAAISNSLNYLNATGKTNFPQSIDQVKQWISFTDMGTPQNWPTIKQAYLEQHGMRVRFLEAPLSLNDIYELIHEVKDGQDIEIDFDGHAAVLLAVRRFEDGHVELDLADDDQLDDVGDDKKTARLVTDGGSQFLDVYPGMALQRFVIECPCTADFNRDGTVNTLDVLAFLNAWNAGDSSADINGDGAVNTLDVLAYLTLWNAGC